MSTTDSSGKEFWMIPDDIKGIEKCAQESDSSSISVFKLKDDIKLRHTWLSSPNDTRLNFVVRMLKSGLFADCTVISRDQTWATHKVILNRCPYFACAFSSGNGFKEAVESKITIENFEPFEVSWLLQYIYGLRIDVEEARATITSGSFLETCTILWSVGDFFRLAELSQSILTQLQQRCRTWLLQTRCASTMLKNIEFLPDLEAGIRAAWRHDRVASPVRRNIISLCVAIHPFAKDHDSFVDLLDEVPEFTAQYVKALLGCPGLQMVEYHEPLATDCDQCHDCIYDSEGVQISDVAYVWTPTSRDFWDNCPRWFCSRACYNAKIIDRDESEYLSD